MVIVYLTVETVSRESFIRGFTVYSNSILFSAIDSFEPKSMVTRKLRRRHYEPLPMVEKRRKVAPLSSLVYVLEENEVEEDVKMIFKVCLLCVHMNVK